MLRICTAQINTRVGDLNHNYEKIISCLESYSEQCDIIVFPELTLTGYPPQDLILNKGFLKKTKSYLRKVVKYSADYQVGLIIGLPIISGGKIFNSAVLIHSGKILKTFKKIALPNYGVFDDKRLFAAARSPLLVEFKGSKFCVLICEDLWNQKVRLKARQLAPDYIICINSSLFDREKRMQRHELVKDIGSPTIYVNQVGGEDDIVFDGRSFISDKSGKIIYEAKAFEEEIKIHDLTQAESIATPSQEEDIYNALILGLRDYVHKTGFSKLLLGLSGGIDSAFVAALASDALGAENVLGVRLPSKYSSDHSLMDAEELAKNLGCGLDTVSIEDVFESNIKTLANIFSGHKEDITEENLQARIRGTLLMAISNKRGYLLLATGNKSEYACGYSTLYGDTCGAFAPIKDLYKTMVYKLARWRNENIPSLSMCRKFDVIPENSITKAPSAELKPNQTDQDSLPEYKELDAILEMMIEKDMSVDEITKEGMNRKTVQRIQKLLFSSEYKRSQAPIGTKITTRDLNKDRRYPIQNGYLS